MQYQKLFSLSGKTIFLAGACGLIGAETAKALAEMGARVVLLDKNQDKGKAIVDVILQSGGQASFEFFDLGDLPGMEKALEDIAQRHGVFHGWINASYPRSKDWPKPLEQMTVDYLRENVDVHLNSTLWASRKVGLMMRANKVNGSIINFGSIYGVQANDLRIYEGTAMAGEMVYCAVKGGIINMTRYLAAHFGPVGIRANSVCPGGIWDHQDSAFVKRYESRVPLKRMGTPTDIAGVIVFLVADASQYVSGTTFMVDGGWTIV